MLMDDRVRAGREITAHRAEITRDPLRRNRDQRPCRQHGVALVVLALESDHVAEKVVI
jgi:hypothetical protein